MDIRNFQYLVEVYRCRSISRAAQNLFISQPHLSRVIRSIEDEFGVTIFVREGGKLTVTSEGEHFLQQVSELLEQYEKLQAPQRPESLLKIATMKHTAVYRGLAAYMKHSSLPLNLKLYDTDYETVVSLVRSSEMQMGVVHLPSAKREIVAQQLRHEGLIYELLYPLYNVISVGKSHPLAGREEVSIEELYDYPLVIMDTGDEYSVFYNEIYAPFFKILDLSRVHQKVNFRDFYALYIFVEEVNGFLLGFSKVPEHTKGNTQVLSLNIREDFERYTSEYGVIYQADLDQQEQARINQVIQALKDV